MEEFKVYLRDISPGMAKNWREKNAFGDEKFSGIIEVIIVCLPLKINKEYADLRRRYIRRGS